jgi:hypothetical protein
MLCGNVLRPDVWSAGCVLGGPNFLQVAERMLNGCDQLEFAHFMGTARRICLRGVMSPFIARLSYIPTLLCSKLNRQWSCFSQ